MSTDQTAMIQWRDGIIPVSTRFDDPYFSIKDGYRETEHVFIAGNNLPDRFRDGFHIGELGFGTGLNMLVALKAWQAAKMNGPLRFTSFEAFPMSLDDMAKALDAFPEAKKIAEPLLASWQKREYSFETPDLIANIIIGDARKTLTHWQGRADAWFLDGFSPAKNPELWEEDIMAEVANHTSPSGTFATYTAAGHVRRALDSAGFEVSRITGFANKRHMSIGHLRDEK